MKVPDTFLIFETDHWLVTHRRNSALAGYLMVGSKTDTTDLSTLSPEALAEFGPVLARAQRALLSLLGAKRVYIGRYGHEPGWPIHFHVIPIYQWVEDLFWHDDRYRVLQAFAEASEEPATDGAELTLFVWREFCERDDPPPTTGPSVHEAVEMLREKMST